MNPEIMKQAGFATELERVQSGRCSACDKPVLLEQFRNAISKREFEISGMCQQCQDDFFGKD